MADAIVTEDSDILLYLATSGSSAHVLYKLDAKNGSCDVLSLDWLLKPKAITETSGKTRKILTALDTFAQLEAKDPGMGVRLFVQACVL